MRTGARPRRATSSTLWRVPVALFVVYVLWVLLSPYISLHATMDQLRDVGAAAAGDIIAGGDPGASGRHGAGGGGNNGDRQLNLLVANFRVDTAEEELLFTRLVGREADGALTKVLFPLNLISKQLGERQDAGQGGAGIGGGDSLAAAQRTRTRTVLQAAMDPTGRRHAYRLTMVVVAMRTRRPLDVVALLRPWEQDACDNHLPVDVAAASPPEWPIAVCLLVLVVPGDFAPSVADHLQTVYEPNKAVVVVQTHSLTSEGISRMHQTGFDAAEGHFLRLFRRPPMYVFFTTIHVEPRMSISKLPFVSQLVYEYEQANATLRAMRERQRRRSTAGGGSAAADDDDDDDDEAATALQQGVSSLPPIADAAGSTTSSSTAMDQHGLLLGCTLTMASVAADPSAPPVEDASASSAANTADGGGGDAALRALVDDPRTDPEALVVVEHGIEFLLGNAQGQHVSAMHAVRRHQGLPLRDERVTVYPESASNPAARRNKRRQQLQRLANASSRKAAAASVAPAAALVPSHRADPALVDFFAAARDVGSATPTQSGVHRAHLRNLSNFVINTRKLPVTLQVVDAVSPYCLLLSYGTLRGLDGLGSYALTSHVYSALDELERMVDTSDLEALQLSERFAVLRNMFHIRLKLLDSLRSSLKFSDVVSGTPVFKRAVAYCIRLCDKGVRVYEDKTGRRWRDAVAAEPDAALLRRLPPYAQTIERKHRDVMDVWPNDGNKIITASAWFVKVLAEFESFGDVGSNAAGGAGGNNMNGGHRDTNGKRAKKPGEAASASEADLFNEETAVWHLSLRARGKQWPTLVTSRAVVKVVQSLVNVGPVAKGGEGGGGDDEATTTRPVSAVGAYQVFAQGSVFPTSHRLTGSFLAKWKDMFAASTDSGGLLPFLGGTGPHTQVVWYTVCCHCCGFSNEIQSLLQPLQRLVHVHSTAEPECFCANASRMLTDTLDRLQLAPKKARRLNPDDIILWVSHTNPTLYHLVRELSEKADYIIGRSMYEFSRLRPKQAQLANQLADEIWVPSKFVYHTYLTSGVEAKRLVLIPEAIDTNLFSPVTAGKMAMPPRELHHECNRPVRGGSSAGPATYTFLSDFKWEPRKGWDVLFEAYLRAFSVRDNVVLYVLTHIWFPGGPETYRWAYNTTFLHEEVVNFVRRNTTLLQHGRTFDDFPTFCIISQEMESAAMAKLYNSVDAFVYSTRGEGWGLPPMQAMSMGKPVIGTNWGGSTEFLRRDNSFLISLDGVVEIPFDSVYGWELGTKWALPSVASTGRLMRHLVENPAHGEAVGRVAREFIVEQFSEQAVGEILAARIQAIREIVIKRRSKQW